MIGVAVRLQVGCACGRMVPINALVTRASCPACHAPVELSLARWQALLPNLVAPDAAAGKTSRITAAGPVLTLDSAREDPRCARCGTAIPSEAPAYAARGYTMCPGCGDRIGVRAVPDALAPVARGASMICGEDADQLAPPAPGEAPNASRPIELRCTGCNAPLPIDGTRRTVRCAYCSTDLFLPDDVWLRMHPLAEVKPFYLCWTSAPRRDLAWHALRDAIVGPDGAVYGVGERPSLWCMGPDLALRWARDDVPPGESKTRIALDARGRLLVWQPGTHSAALFAPHDGAAIGRLGGEEPVDAAVHHLDLERASALCPDPDGTLLALVGANLVRFDADGTGVATWPARAGMFGAKHEKLQPLYTRDRQLRAPAYVDLAAVHDRPLALPSSTRLHVGADGSVYAHDVATLARFDRRGAVVYKIALPIDVVASRRIASDAAGACYAIGTRPGPYPREHVLVRVSPDGARVEAIATDHAHGGSLGTSDDVTLAVAPDGTCYALEYGTSVRVLAPDGSPRYLSQTARDDDARAAAERARRA